MPLTNFQLSQIDSNTNGYMRNRIINGAMVIDQRNAGASVTGNAGVFVVDRWQSNTSQSSKMTMQQNANSITPPTGFSNYVGITSSSAYSLTSTDYFLFEQRIEGYNVSDFGWGTASASPITISFWVRSSLTGLFGGALQDGSPARNFPFSFTINSANTWEYKTVAVSGDTSVTGLNSTNGVGLYVRFSMGTGSSYLQTAGSWTSSSCLGATGQTNLVATNGATFYITGVQLEVGSVATPFERRQFGQELNLCERYYQFAEAVNEGYIGGANNTADGVTFRQTMRATPTISFTNLQNGGTSNGSYSAANTQPYGVGVYCGSTGAGTFFWYVKITASAEL
jgi:hypothetical protein